MYSRVVAGLSLLAAVLVSTTSCSPPVPDVVPGVSLDLAQQRARSISNVGYRLRFDIPEDAEQPIDGHVAISFELSDAGAPLQIDFRAGQDAVRDLTIDGRESAYRVENEHIVIQASELDPGTHEIMIGFVAGSASLNRNPEYLYTLFVPDRARTAFPVFDQPDLKATFQLTLTVPAGWQALSNAPVDSIEDSGERKIYRFGESDRISSYLFSFVAGRFESISLERNGRVMTMLHRETDEEKVRRNLEAIFDLHAASVEWLEAYTGVAYPFQKLDFVLIPAFQYGGMEHVGAILYRASRLLLDESPTDTELLRRASVIAHETAHAWFGNLVTMEWFDDVWMKEVFANFMAAKAVNPAFPQIDHDLGFLADHYPSAYSIDRTAGANPIRQDLPNLDEAGQLYGPIIYNKAPIMMRQLERLVGEEPFREGIRRYLQKYAFGNAGWPALIDILDEETDEDLRRWSEVWVNTAGRPDFSLVAALPSGDVGPVLVQHDNSGRGRVWPQSFEVTVHQRGQSRVHEIVSAAAETPLGFSGLDGAEDLVFNSDGFGYGQFPADIDNLRIWDALGNVEKGSELINLFESVLEGRGPAAREYFLALETVVPGETNQLLLDLALGQLEAIYWRLLSIEDRDAFSTRLEETLWESMLAQQDASRKKIFFDAYAAVAISPDGVGRVYDVWSGRLVIEQLFLSENDLIDHARTLAIKMPDRADEIVAGQLARTENPDNQRRLRFIAPSMSADAAVRDRFFDSLADVRNRQVESWVLEALDNLHHPLRTGTSEKYLRPSLDLLQEIQVTGDIFFPSDWLQATFRNYRSTSAVRTVDQFLAERPDLSAQLRMKILQATDLLVRASSMDRAEP